MRLLHTREDRFEEFQIRADSHGQRWNPKYAILSHRWGKDEVSYQEFLWLTSSNQLVGGKLMVLFTPMVIDKDKGKGAGFAKIQNFRWLANLAGYDWVWIDTCCIDKSSSAELSEAINSMFFWYASSRVCWAYLDDVHPTAARTRRKRVSASEITGSKWFTRGWTLQELIAPEELIFYDADWSRLGSKSSLADAISRRTTISQEVLKAPFERLHYPIATRMRWAAGRETTRIEDQAYSLLGIFNINLPLIYGEGGKAFDRLQEEIVRTSSDTSILLHDGAHRLFANKPAEFINTGLVDERSKMEKMQKMPWNLWNRLQPVKNKIRPRIFGKTNLGLHINALTVPVPAIEGSMQNLRLVLLVTFQNGSSRRPHYLVVRNDDDSGVLRDRAMDDVVWTRLGNSVRTETFYVGQSFQNRIERVFERWDAWCISVQDGALDINFNIDEWCERLNMTIKGFM
jgi:hypothetical protein